MFSGRIAVLTVDKSDKLCIRQRNSLPISKRAVQRHFQGIRHILNGLAISDAELVILSMQIQVESSGNYGVVKGMDCTLNIFDHLGGRFYGFPACVGIVSFGACPDNPAARKYGYSDLNTGIGIHFNDSISRKRCIRQVVGSGCGFIAVLWYSVDDARLNLIRHHRDGNRFVGIVGGRHRNLLFLFLGGYRKHIGGNAIQLRDHIRLARVLLLHGGRISS